MSTSESVKVIVKCRPMNERELILTCSNCIEVDTKTGSCSIRSHKDKNALAKQFTFDGAYGPDSTNQKIYSDIVFPLVEGVMEGYNGTVFAYGQTGCGKTFSMQGIAESDSERGIIPQAFDQIFDTVMVAENTKYLIRASYLEIYNEEIRDLLGVDTKARLELKEKPDGGVFIKDLSMHPCSNVKECTAVMAIGWKHRAVGSTLMNAASSRSHSIFTIHLERWDDVSKDGAIAKSFNGGGRIRASKLNLVDLAGSERQDKTHATGDRFKEATKINLSLSALGNVISALVDSKALHVPYRDSKLTRLLQDSLGGNTKTLMVACLSPADNNYEESLTTLRYANRAKNIKNKPKINEDPKDAMIRNYLKEINSLKAILDERISVVAVPELTLYAPTDIDNQYGDKIKSLSFELDVAKTTQEEVTSEIIKVREEASMMEKQQREHAEKLMEESRVFKEQCDQRVTKIFEELEQVKSSKEQVEYEMVMLQVKFDQQVKAVENLALPEEVEAEKARLRMEFDRELLAMKDELDSAKQMNFCANEEMMKLQQSFAEAEERASQFISLDELRAEKIKLNADHERVISKLREELDEVQQCKDQTITDIAMREQLHNEELKEYALKPEQIEAEKSILKIAYEKEIQGLLSELYDLKKSKRRTSEEMSEKNQEHNENLRLLEASAAQDIIDNKPQECSGLEIKTNEASLDLSNRAILEDLLNGDRDNNISTTKDELAFNRDIEKTDCEIHAEYEAYTQRKTDELNCIRGAKENLAKRINRLKMDYQKAIEQTVLSTVLPERLVEEKIIVKSCFEVEMARNRDQLTEIKDSRATICREVNAKRLIITNYQTEIGRLRRMLRNGNAIAVVQINEAAMRAQEYYDSCVKHSDLMLQIQNEQERADRMESNYALASKRIDEDIKLGKVKEDVGDRMKMDLKRKTKNGIQHVKQRQTELFELDDRLRQKSSACELLQSDSDTECVGNRSEKFANGFDSQEAAKRLDELQHLMIGGDEQSGQVHSVRAKLLGEKQHAENNRLMLERALLSERESHMILYNLYTRAEDEMLANSSAVHSLTLENEQLFQEVHDLTCEFQYDREDYLDTIRGQDRTIKWYEAIAEKILPALRRDANYLDLDRIKVQSEWDDLNQRWNVPAFKIDKMTLPSAAPGRRASSAFSSSGIMTDTNSPRFYVDQYPNNSGGDLEYELRSEDRFIQRLNDSSQTDPGQNYFRPNSRSNPDFGDGSLGHGMAGYPAQSDLQNLSRPSSRRATNNYPS